MRYATYLHHFTDPTADERHEPSSIIVVQGLGAHPYYTWVKKTEPVKSRFLQKRRAPSPNLGDTAQIASNTAKVMWLRDLLPAVVPNARIASYSYESDWRRDLKTAGMQACGDVMIMIGQHGRSVHEVIPAYLWGKGDSHFSSCCIIT